MKTLVACASALLLLTASSTAEARGKAPGRRALSKKKSERSQYRHYRKLVAATGGKLDTTPDQRTVIGLRGVDARGQLHAEGKRKFRAYTDVFVVIWIDRAGKPHVRHFVGSTTPGQAATRYAGTPDADKDGTKDIAHLAPGKYLYKARKFKGKSAYGNGKRVPCYRDTDHDGWISRAEKRASVKRGDTADGILFHRGRETRPSSVGCQTMKPAIFGEFERALGGDKTWEYFLIDVRSPLRPRP